MKRLCLLVLALLLANPLGAEPGRVALRSGSIEAAATPSEPGGPDARIRLVQFAGPPTAAQLEALAGAVDKIYTYLPEHSFLVRAVQGGSLVDDMAAIGAAWTGPFAAAAKISPEIAAAGGEPNRLRQVMIHLFPDLDLAASVAQLEALVGKKAEGSAARARFSRARFLLTEEEIAALRKPISDLPSVFWIERESRKALNNDSSIVVGQSGPDGSTTPLFAHGLLGAGQVVAVLDTGVDIDSCYFWDAANGLPAMNVCNGGTSTEPAQRKVIAVNFLWQTECNGGISATEWDTQGHGSHVGGTVAGDDFAQLGIHNNRDGMAPQAKLVIQDGGFQTNDCADMPAIGCPVVDLVPIFQQPYAQGARIHTNSWGDEENDPAFGQYTAGSQDADETMWADKDYLLIFAAGNNGGTTNTVDSPSTAKSVISVGSTLRGGGAGTISGFSSRGPTDDSRIKPDVTFPGSDISSCGNDSNINTFTCVNSNSSGTSMAAPGVAGMAALTRQYYAQGYYPSGAANAPDGWSPSAALVKATLINSAAQMSAQGNIPNNAQGWGRVLLDNALYLAGDARRLFADDNAAGFPNGSSGQTRTYQINVAAGQPFKVTVAWTDFPSTPAAAFNLVNDIDLEVTGPDGTFLGNVWSGGQSATGGSADRRNNVEQVLRNTPTAGLWTITLRSFTVPQGPQPFALVATGGISACSGAASAAAVAGSETLAIFGGDGDASLDNCETARLSFSVANTGTTAATAVQVVSVSSPSHPGITFATPTWTTPSIAGCGSASGAFVDLAGVSGLANGNTVQVDVVTTNAQIAPATRTTRLQITGVESDLQQVASRVYDFETGLEGWTVQSGTFNRVSTLGGAGGSSFYLQSSAALANQCDVITSPEVLLTPSSTLQVFTRYDIEPGPEFFDRANVSVLDGAAPNWVAPDGGRPYDVPNGSANGTCGTAGEGGWAGASPASWSASTFSASSLGAAGLAGRPVRLDVRYGTDPGDHRAGFRIDRVELTNIEQRGADGQSNVCETGLIFADGFETGNTSRWN
jgi:hypothetical protein